MVNKKSVNQMHFFSHIEAWETIVKTSLFFKIQSELFPSLLLVGIYLDLVESFE
jgi:hypothetical protein